MCPYFKDLNHQPALVIGINQNRNAILVHLKLTALNLMLCCVGSAPLFVKSEEFFSTSPVCQ